MPINSHNVAQLYSGAVILPCFPIKSLQGLPVTNTI